MVIICVWTGVFSTFIFYILKKFDVLRTPPIDEIVGLDIAELGDPLPDFSKDCSINYIQRIKRAESVSGYRK
jgi:ammonia channel protein AmtB